MLLRNDGVVSPYFSSSKSVECTRVAKATVGVFG
jgi:hypothetical protein